MSGSDGDGQDRSRRPRDTVVNEVMVYLREMGLMNPMVPACGGPLRAVDTVGSIYTIISYADLALREFRRADDLLPQLVGNSFVSVEIMSSFVRNVNKFILGRVEDETFKEELFTEQLRMLGDTGYNLAQSSKSIWDVILDVFEWASVEACFGEPVYELYVIINWWLGKLEQTALVRNFQRRIAPSKRTFDSHGMPDTLIHREVVYGNHAVATFNERVLSIESTRLLAEYDWRRWKYRVEDYAFLDGWERADNMTELYVLREKIRHLFK